jgi:argininosuccinate lyase
MALDRNVRLLDLSLAEFREVCPELDESIYGVLGVAKAVEAMQSYGSTAPQQVRQQVECWKLSLGGRHGHRG